MYRLLDFFPDGYTPTLNQISVLDRIQDKFYSDKKHLIIQAPTGSGKSFIAKTLANTTSGCSSNYKELVRSGSIYSPNTDTSEYLHGCFSLTIRKVLQDQYSNLFEDSKILKGKGNYECVIYDDHSVEDAPCNYLDNQLKKCKKDRCCLYYNAMDDLLVSKFGCLSYSKYLSLENHLKRRELLILDEVSELEQELVQRFTLIFYHSDFNKVGIDIKISDNRDLMHETITDWYERFDEKISDIKKKLLDKNKAHKISSSKNLHLYYRYRRIFNDLRILKNSFKASEYIIEDKVDDDKKSIIKFTPLRVNLLSSNIFDYGKKVVSLSATIIGIKNFTRILGIKSDDYDYIDIDSDFDHKKSPIRVSNNINLTRKYIDKDIVKMLESVEVILSNYNDCKGIIHTHNFSITNYIQENIDDKFRDRLLFRERGVMENHHVLEMHKNSDNPTVIVSPSMSYGVDLKDELGRFQIIVKCPWLSLVDSRVEKMSKLDYKWYVYNMLNSMVQASGRCTRNKDDYCDTYILDSSFIKHYRTFKKDLPSFFRKRIE